MNTILEQTPDGWTRWPERSALEPWEVAWDLFMQERKALYAGKMNLQELTCRQAFARGWGAKPNEN